MLKNRSDLIQRAVGTKLETREEVKGDQGLKTISGYFVKFGDETQLWDDVFEEISPEAFDGDTLQRDVRALINHDTTLVLGRTRSNTLKLSTDATGLYGTIVINENDTDAMNLYERVKRGDVNQCSFGFRILKEDMQEDRINGTVKFVIKSVELYEVSVCTFPAYASTEVEAREQKITQARKNKIDERKKNSLNEWKEKTLKKLKN